MMKAKKDDEFKMKVVPEVLDVREFKKYWISMIFTTMCSHGMETNIDWLKNKYADSIALLDYIIQKS